MYDEEEWLPTTVAAAEDADGGSDDDNDNGGGDSVAGQSAEKRHVVSKAVLKDLGNKFSGDEMDIIAKTASHNYYLRSLEQSQAYPQQQQQQPLGSTKAATATATTATTVICPYDIPELHLPAPPAPKGNTAADFYEALNTRDLEIRKGAPLCWGGGGGGIVLLSN